MVGYMRINPYYKLTENKTHTSQLLSHGDICKTIISQKTLFTYKFRAKWTVNPEERASCYFISNIKQLMLYPSNYAVFTIQIMIKNVAMLKLAYCYRKVEISGFKDFNVVLNSITLNYLSSNYQPKYKCFCRILMQKIKGLEVKFRGFENRLFMDQII
jgi:hypothetical protein